MFATPCLLPEWPIMFLLLDHGLAPAFLWLWASLPLVLATPLLLDLEA
jgi:hypothetical protein